MLFSDIGRRGRGASRRCVVVNEVRWQGANLVIHPRKHTVWVGQINHYHGTFGLPIAFPLSPRMFTEDNFSFHLCIA